MITQEQAFLSKVSSGATEAGSGSDTQRLFETVGEARLRPRDDSEQRLLSLQLALDPPTPLCMVADRFGNTIPCYSVPPPHQRMIVTATSVVETSGAAISW